MRITPYRLLERVPNSYEKRIFVAILYIICSFFCQNIKGQALNPNKPLSQFILNTWQQDDGLPQNTVHALLQSRDGYIWAGTYQGIARFDGVQFKTFNMANTSGLLSNGIWSIAEDYTGALWFGTNGGGLARYSKNSFQSYRKSEGLPQDIVRNIYIDKEQYMWLAFTSGLGRMKVPKNKNERIQIELVNGLERMNVLAIVQDQKGQIWVGCREGLFLIYNTSKGWLAIRYETKIDLNVYSLSTGKDSSLWIGTNDGLYHFRNNAFKRFGVSEGLSEARIACIYSDRIGTIWALTVSGELNRYYKGSFSHLSIKNDFQDNRIYSILEDHEGSLWFGTSRSGMHRLKESKVSFYGRSDGLNADVNYAVLEGKNESIYIGTRGGGVNIIKDNKVTHISTKHGLSVSYSRSIAFDRLNRLWVGSYGSGIDIVETSKAPRVIKRITKKNGLGDEFVRVIKMLHDGNIIVGTRKGLNLIHNYQVIASYDKINNVEMNPVLCIENNEDGIAFIGTDGGGVNVLEDGKLSKVKTSQALPSEVVLSLLWDQDSKILWIGTNTGLAFYRNGIISSVVSPSMKMPHSILQLIDDKSGQLWMGSTNGVYEVSKKDLIAFADNKIREFSIQHYGIEDGLRSIECTPNGHPSSMRSKDGRLWFPTSKGTVVVEPWNIPRNTKIPNVVIEGVDVNNDWKSTSSELIVDPGTPRFQIHYTALSFMGPKKVRFRYRLTGYDETWIDADTRRVAYYTSLPPGDYKFQVQACNNDDVWNTNGATLNIKVLPFFHQTSYFLVLVCIGVFGIGLAIYQIRIRDLKRQNQALERMVQSRTAELNKASERVYDSITYASKIQTALLPDLGLLSNWGLEISIHYAQRDIVGGDFFWFEQVNGQIIIVVADCTGHGVPGAFMSVLGLSLLNQIVVERGIIEPSQILDQLDNEVRRALRQDGRDGSALDGMDLAVLSYFPALSQISFALANRPLLYKQGGSIVEYKPTRRHIGGRLVATTPFQIHSVWAETGDEFFVFTDGVTDQIGGQQGKKWGIDKLQNWLRSRTLKDKEFMDSLNNELKAWQGPRKQLDDQLMLGIRIIGL